MQTKNNGVTPLFSTSNNNTKDANHNVKDDDNKTAIEQNGNNNNGVNPVCKMIGNEALVEEIDIGGVDPLMDETINPRNKAANKNYGVTPPFSKSGNKGKDAYHNTEDGINISTNNNVVTPF